jgi:hypothetical protein
VFSRNAKNPKDARMIPQSPIARRDFLRLTGIAAGSLAVTPAFAASAGASEVLRSRTDRLATGASRRTDIPAFYAEWMVRRLREGYCTVADPYNRNQVTWVSLKPEDVGDRRRTLPPALCHSATGHLL